MTFFKSLINFQDPTSSTKGTPIRFANGGLSVPPNQQSWHKEMCKNMAGGGHTNQKKNTNDSLPSREGISGKWNL